MDLDNAGVSERPQSFQECMEGRGCAVRRSAEPAATLAASRLLRSRGNETWSCHSARFSAPVSRAMEFGSIGDSVMRRGGARSAHSGRERIERRLLSSGYPGNSAIQQMAVVNRARGLAVVRWRVGGGVGDLGCGTPPVRCQAPSRTVASEQRRCERHAQVEVHRQRRCESLGGNSTGECQAPRTLTRWAP